MNKRLAFVGALFMFGCAVGWFLSQDKGKEYISQDRGKEYNSYLKKLRPINNAQDDVWKEMRVWTIASARGKIENWRARLKEQLRMTQKIVPKKRQIKEIHAHWLRRSQHLVDGIEAFAMYLKTKNSAHLNAFTKHFKLARKAMKDFAKQRNKYLQKYNLRLKKK